MTPKRLLSISGWLIGALALAGCETLPDTVVFGQAHTVGISIGQSQAAPAPEFVLGYKDANIALLPTVMRDADENPQKLGGISKAGNAEFNETFSVLGQFEVNSPTATQSESDVGLGKFFATGLAAQKLAAGFACGVSKQKDKAHCHP